jgi:hypothetical protein
MQNKPLRRFFAEEKVLIFAHLRPLHFRISLAGKLDHYRLCS